MNTLSFCILLGLLGAAVAGRTLQPVLKGAFCQGCQVLIQSEESRGEYPLNRWIVQRVQDVCSNAGFFRRECIAMFTNNEKNFANAMRRGDAALESCQDLDFC